MNRKHRRYIHILHINIEPIAISSLTIFNDFAKAPGSGPRGGGRGAVIGARVAPQAPGRRQLRPRRRLVCLWVLGWVAGRYRW